MSYTAKGFGGVFLSEFVRCIDGACSVFFCLYINMWGGKLIKWGDMLIGLRVILLSDKVLQRGDFY